MSLKVISLFVYCAYRGWYQLCRWGPSTKFAKTVGCCPSSCDSSKAWAEEVSNKHLPESPSRNNIFIIFCLQWTPSMLSHHYWIKKSFFLVFCWRQTVDDVIRVLESTMHRDRYRLKVKIQWLHTGPMHYIIPCVLLFISCSVIEAATDDVI